MGQIVDLRSDSVTLPSPGMRQAMALAAVGDDGYGEDPTVAKLEQTVADMFGHQAALLVPTCTMANQIGLQLLLRPGDELICATDAEVVSHAHGALAALGGISTRTCTSGTGLLEADAVAAILSSPEYWTNPTRAIAVEQTANRAGGRIYPLDALADLRKLAVEAGVPMFLDGARIFNANVATGVPLHEYGQLVDVLSVCLTKGLGAPVGALVVGSAGLLQRGRMLRKRLGGAMRQAGFLAAAGLYALEHHVPLLAGDHQRAQALAAALSSYGVIPQQVDTNIVLLDLRCSLWSAAAFVAAANTHGVRCFAVSASQVRLVFHLDVHDAHLDHTIQVFSGLLEERR